VDNLDILNCYLLYIIMQSLGSQAFRKEYGRIGELRSFVPATMGVFTATLTLAMRQEVVEKTGLRRDNMREIIMSPDR
jgi:superfamily II DNA helicase RecQ